MRLHLMHQRDSVTIMTIGRREFGFRKHRGRSNKPGDFSIAGICVRKCPRLRHRCSIICAAQIRSPGGKKPGTERGIRRPPVAAFESQPLTLLVHAPIAPYFPDLQHAEMADEQ